MAPIRFNQASLRDIFSSIAKGTGINITFDSTFQDRVYTVDLSEVTLAEALDQIVTANQLFYKVLNAKTIIVIPDNAQKRAQYEEQLVQNFYISHVDPLELAQMLNQVIRPIGGQQLAPVISANKTASVINVRATTAMMAIIERMIESNDKPRAEVIVDVQILEVNRSRAKKYGIDLGNYAINAVFSPERDPRSTATTGASVAQLAAVQRQYDHARDQRERLLSGRAVRGDSLPRERQRDEGHRQAAAARRRRARRWS